MVVPNTFKIYLINTYQSVCANCCFLWIPEIKTSLDQNSLLEAINALDPAQVELISFTGIEPFLLGTQLVELVRHANNLGFGTKVVTNGYFAINLAAAQSHLAPLAEAGISELSMDWDDSCEEFVPLDRITNLFTAVRDYPDIIASISM